MRLGVKVVLSHENKPIVDGADVLPSIYKLSPYEYELQNFPVPFQHTSRPLRHILFTPFSHFRAERFLFANIGLRLRA
jgi:chlorite dismutase